MRVQYTLQRLSPCSSLLMHQLFRLTFLLVIFCCIPTTYTRLIKECRIVGAEELIDEEGCGLFIVRVNRCSGQCLSFSFPNPLTHKHTVHAKCCRIVDSEWVTATLSCEDGPREVKIPSATECQCFDCSLNSVHK